MPASRAACALAAAAAALAASLPGVQPAGRAAWDLRTTGRQGVVRGAQESCNDVPRRTQRAVMHNIGFYLYTYN